MANDEPPGSPPSSHGSREEKEKNVDKDLTLIKAKETVEKFLPGPAFAPTDDEIIGNYLKKRVEGQLSPTNFIRDVDDIFSCSPDKLFRKYKIKAEEEGYFFSPLKGCSHGKCIATDDGFWKYTNTMRTFSDGNGRGTMVGRKQQLQFFEKNETAAELETKWVMEEYCILNVLGPAADKPKKVDDIVLRKIYNTDYLKKPEYQEEEGGGGDDDIADNDPPNYRSSSEKNQPDDDNSGDDTSHDQSSCAENQLEEEEEKGGGGGGEDGDIADNDPPNYRSSSAENQPDDDNSDDDTSHDQSSGAENKLDDDADTFDAQSSSEN